MVWNAWVFAIRVSHANQSCACDLDEGCNDIADNENPEDSFGRDGRKLSTDTVDGYTDKGVDGSLYIN